MLRCFARVTPGNYCFVNVDNDLFVSPASACPEHRNMPLDDAITLMTRNFEVYVQELREKATQRETSSRKEPPEFLPPDQHTSYLLNLLADNRILTLEELDHVLGYLQKRRQKIIGTKGGRTG